jgi:hypothetical protein
MNESLQTAKTSTPWRFGPGNQAAKGHRSPAVKYRDVVRKATKPGDVKAVFEQLAAKARAGDLAAVKLYLAYAVGEPNQVIDLTHHVGEVDIPAAIQALLASGASLAAELQLDVEYLGQ